MIEPTQHQREVARRLVHDIPNIDLMLPTWARRKNPLVARELGEYWRVYPPELLPTLKWIVAYAVLLTVTFFFPFLFVLIVIPVLVSVITFPFILYQYGLAVLAILQDSSRSIAREYESNTMDLLRVTPFSTRDIILSKIVAGVWRRADTWNLLTLYTVALGVPIIVTTYLSAYQPEFYGGLPQFMSLIALISYLIRIPLELIMVSSVGVLMGTLIKTRQNSASAAIFLVGFYFVLINMLRFISLDWHGRLFLDAVVPLLCPIIISWFSIQQAIKNLEQS